MLIEVFERWLEYYSVSGEQVLWFAALTLFANSLIQGPPSEYACIALAIAYSSLGQPLTELWLVCSLANLAGTIPWYFLGKSKRFANWLDRFFPDFDQESGGRLLWIRTRMRQLYSRAQSATGSFLRPTTATSTVLSLVVWRNIPLLRSICSFFFARLGVGFPVFFVFSAIGIGIWCGFWLMLGEYFHSSGGSIPIAMVLLAIPLVTHVVWNWVLRKRTSV